MGRGWHVRAMLMYGRCTQQSNPHPTDVPLWPRTLGGWNNKKHVLPGKSRTWNWFSSESFFIKSTWGGYSFAFVNLSSFCARPLNQTKIIRTLNLIHTPHDDIWKMFKEQLASKNSRMTWISAYLLDFLVFLFCSSRILTKNCPCKKTCHFNCHTIIGIFR